VLFSLLANRITITAADLLLLESLLEEDGEDTSPLALVRSAESGQAGLHLFDAGHARCGSRPGSTRRRSRPPKLRPAVRAVLWAAWRLRR